MHPTSVVLEGHRGVEFHRNCEAPPLEFAPTDGTFDLVYSASVFTHIPFDTQELWIKEIAHVIRPGGFLLCDMLGRFHQQAMLGSDELSRLNHDGTLTITQTDANASLATKLIGSWDVFATGGRC